MKKAILTLITFLAMMARLSAQSPQAFNYQGVARDLSGTALATKNISVKASILDGSSAGNILYAETHSVATNPFGLFTLSIGKGSVTNGSFANIGWGSGDKYLKIEIDPNGGSSYTLSGTTQLLSVPYAMYAASAGDSKWNDVTGGINYGDGRVGIGTSTPEAWLSIEKNVSGEDRPLFLVNNLSNLQDSYSGSSFSAGTGTNKNSLMIQVNSEGYFPNLGTSGQSFITAKQLVLQSQPNNNAADGFVSISTGGTYDGLNKSAERLRVTYDGKVGIGTTAPSAILHSNGTVRLQGLASNNALTNALVTDINGNVYTKDISTFGTSQWQTTTTGINYNAGDVSVGNVMTDQSCWFKISKDNSGANRRAMFAIENTSDGQTSNSGVHIKSGTQTNASTIEILAHAKSYFPNLGTAGYGSLRSEKLDLWSIANTNASDGFIVLRTGGNYATSVDSKEKIRIDYNGNVGIGTATPTAILHTNGTIRFQGLTNNNTLTNALVTDDNGNVYTKDISILGISQWTNVTGGINYSSGKVGIGTNTPSSPLDIIGGTVNSPTISIRSGNDYASSITFYGGKNQEQGGGIVYYATDFTLSSDRVNAGNLITSGGPNGLLFRAYGNGEIKFSTVSDRLSGQSLERMRIDKNGNVGIGTTIPTATLHTNGTVRFEGLTVNSTLTNALVTDGNGNVYTKDISSLGISQWTNVTGGINYSGGRVGIGTTTPITKLNIVGNFTGTDRNAIELYNTSTGQDGICGIGLSVNDPNSDRASLQVFSSNYFPSGLPFSAGRTILNSLSKNGIKIEANAANANLEFAVGPSYVVGSLAPQTPIRMIIKTDGNVGIGTLTPTALLHTNGSIRFQGLTNNSVLTNALVTDANGNVYTKDISTLGNSQWTNVTGGINYNGGKVGIGTANPGAFLSIERKSAYDERAFIYLVNTDDSEFSSVLNATSAGTGSNQTHFTINTFAKSYYPTDFLKERTGTTFLESDKLVLASNTSDGYIAFRTGVNPETRMGSGMERLRIDALGNMGIGTTTPKAKLQIASGDVYIDDATKGIIMKNNSGECYRITVGTAGALVSTNITCP